MKIIIIISIYIINIFISRWLNKKAIIYSKFVKAEPILWFVPLIGISAYLILFITTYLVYKGENKFTKWFFLSKYKQ